MKLNWPSWKIVLREWYIRIFRLSENKVTENGVKLMNCARAIYHKHLTSDMWKKVTSTLVLRSIWFNEWPRYVLFRTPHTNSRSIFHPPLSHLMIRKILFSFFFLLLVFPLKDAFFLIYKKGKLIGNPKSGNGVFSSRGSGPWKFLFVFPADFLLM